MSSGVGWIAPRVYSAEGGLVEFDNCRRDAAVNIDSGVTGIVSRIRRLICADDLVACNGALTNNNSLNYRPVHLELNGSATGYVCFLLVTLGRFFPDEI